VAHKHRGNGLGKSPAVGEQATCFPFYLRRRCQGCEVQLYINMNCFFVNAFIRIIISGSKLNVSFDMHINSKTATQLRLWDPHLLSKTPLKSTH
jgi:hypothetical protein